MGLEVFTEISVVIVIALLMAVIMRLLKQPLIISYILTGIIVSPYFLNLIKFTDTIHALSQMGVAFLLFIVGLSLSPKVIKEVGKVSLITGVGQVVFTSILGYGISRLLGFSIITSLYIAIALTFSSTIIIMKLLSDRKDLDKLYGKISIGFLLVQDLIAIFILIVVSSISRGDISNLAVETIGKSIVTLLVLYVVSKSILPKLNYFFAKSQELLFLFSIAWGLGWATFFYYLGFSIEIGALAAGVMLSLSPYHTEITSKMKPLRDFFIILFFILVGSNMAFGDIRGLILPAMVFSLFILIGNPLIVMILMGILGYSKRNGFMAGLTVAQISEFSLILIALGINVGHISSEILSLVTIVGLITIAGSTYFIIYADSIYKTLSGRLSIFERAQLKKEKKKLKKYELVLFGYNRVGYDILKVFKKLKKKYLVVDYNPDVIDELTDKRIGVSYGDADDEEFLLSLNLKNIKMAVSTVPDFETNLMITKKIREANSKAIIMIISHDVEEAYSLYEEGASYVILPHFLGGSYASRMIDEYGLNQKKFLKERARHKKYLIDRLKRGHRHPIIEKN